MDPSIWSLEMSCVKIADFGAWRQSKGPHDHPDHAQEAKAVEAPS